MAVLLAGCAQAVKPVTVRSDTPTRAAVADVPLILQEDFYCGPASIAMVMQWAGNNVSQAEIARQSFTPGARGTYISDMLGAARRQGQIAVTVTGWTELLAEVSAGNPVIVFQNLGLSWAPQWHYGVVVGYDLDRDEIYLNSGQLDRLTMSLALFNRTWQRGAYWALAVMPPDRLPATADELEVLRAASALEKVGQAEAAETVYLGGYAEWPQNWIWQFGLGNARYAKGDLVGARQAFRRALSINPDAPEIRQNLAQVEAELAG